MIEIGHLDAVKDPLQTYGTIATDDDVIAAVVGGHDTGKAPHHTCRVTERGGKAVGLIGAEAPPSGKAQRVERLALVVGSGDHHLAQHDIEGLQLYIEDRLLSRHHSDRQLTAQEADAPHLDRPAPDGCTELKGAVLSHRGVDQGVCPPDEDRGGGDGCIGVGARDPTSDGPLPEADHREEKEDAEQQDGLTTD